MSADADCTGARIEEDDDEDRGFPLRVSSTRADSATPSLLYLNQHVAGRITRGGESIVDDHARFVYSLVFHAMKSRFESMSRAVIGYSVACSYYYRANFSLSSRVATSRREVDFSFQKDVLKKGEFSRHEIEREH